MAAGRGGCRRTDSGREQQAHLPRQLTEPKRGEALLREQRWVVRAKGASLAPQLGTPPPAAPVLSGAGPSPAVPGERCHSTTSPQPLPSSRAPAASSPPVPALQGCFPHHWAQQSAGWSSFQSCHFFFISDFTCRGGGGESGGFSLAVPSPRSEQASWGTAELLAEAGPSPSAGRRSCSGYVPPCWRSSRARPPETPGGEQASEPPVPPPLPGLGWA